MSSPKPSSMRRRLWLFAFDHCIWTNPKRNNQARPRFLLHPEGKQNLPNAHVTKNTARVRCNNTHHDPLVARFGTLKTIVQIYPAWLRAAQAHTLSTAQSTHLSNLWFDNESFAHPATTVSQLLLKLDSRSNTLASCRACLHPEDAIVTALEGLVERDGDGHAQHVARVAGIDDAVVVHEPCRVVGRVG